MEGLPFHLSHSQFFILVPACYLRFLFLLFTILLSCLAYSSLACHFFRCGHLTFEYPFGLTGSGCGDPALQIDCEEEKFPLLNIRGHQYQVLSPQWISVWSKRITIIDKNLEGRDKCNPLSSNYTVQTLSSSQFHIEDGYKNITLWGDCKATYTDAAAPLGCNNSWHYNLTSDLRSLDSCKSQIVLPVAESVVTPDQIQDGGLRIIWELSQNCTDCESSQGFCGYDNSMQFYCNCSGTLHPNKCPAHKSKTPVIIGCSIGGAGLVAAVVLFLIYYVRRRKVAPTQGLGSDFNNYHRNDMEAGPPGSMLGSLSIFPYQELQQATNFFDEKNELGDGGFGAVYLGKLQDGRVVAVKRLYEENSRRVEQFINEVKILSSLCHPNLVRLYGCTSPHSPMLLLVYEFVPNGTLSDHLHGSRRTLTGLTWGTRLNIAIETARALAYLHGIDPPIFHRDVKSNNILLDEYFKAKVADFGLSRLVPVNVSHVTTTPQGTPGYVDPEYHQCFQLTEKSDVYSFGVVLVEIISAKVAVDITRNRSEISLANMAIDKIKRGVLDELVDPDLKIERNHEVKVMVTAVAELAYQCLATERDFRPGMKEVVSRLEEIKQLQESKDFSNLTSITPTASPISVQEKWPIIASAQSAKF